MNAQELGALANIVCERFMEARVRMDFGTMRKLGETMDAIVSNPEYDSDYVSYRNRLIDEILKAGRYHQYRIYGVWCNENGEPLEEEVWA